MHAKAFPNPYLYLTFEIYWSDGIPKQKKNNQKQLTAMSASRVATAPVQIFALPEGGRLTGHGDIFSPSDQLLPNRVIFALWCWVTFGAVSRAGR